MKTLIEVFRSPKKSGAYLYLPMNKGTADLPAALLAIFGPPESVMKLAVTPDKKLAKVTGEKVLAAIADQGFYLQLPDIERDEMAELAEKNAKLSRG